MTDRLADVSERIAGIRQLGAVVNAMKGIAAARARTARTQLEAVDSYTLTVSSAMSSVLDPADAAQSGPASPETGEHRRGLLLFLAEQGFAGAFSQRVLDGTDDDMTTAHLFIIGTRGLSVAAARGLKPDWHAAMPSHTPGIPKLADAITRAIWQALDNGRIDRVDVVHASWISGKTKIETYALFPISRPDAPPPEANRPLTQISGERLLASLGADYVHALICKAALHAFAAENEARMEAMTAAGSQIARELDEFQARLRRVRQEAITAEIIELGTGAVAARDAR